ncbi:MAG: replicative DNA helicase [bacterium]
MNENLQGLTPPHDDDAEKALLGSILLNNKILDDVADKLKPEFFYDPRHQVIYNLMLQLWAQNKPIDVIFLLNALESSNLAKDLGQSQVVDKEFLLELISKSSLSSIPEETAKIVKDKHLLRTIIETSDDLKILALNKNTAAEDILDAAQKKLYEISMDNVDKNFVSIKEILVNTFERISYLRERKEEVRGVPTGFTDLDKILNGFQNSDLIILAARPSMGKTALALEMAKRIALNNKVGVALFSLEMSKDQLVDRLLSSVSGIEMYKIRTGKFTEEESNTEFMKLGSAIGELDQAPIWIDDSGGLNILELRSKARRLKSRHNIGVLIIDYLQLMNGGASRYAGNRVQEVSDISRGLKMLARELNIPIIALSQLSRSVDSRDDKRPMLSDLRESGSIEQDADVVLFVHREEMYNKETKKKGIADITISKHRNGSTGQIELAWVGKLATFENLEGAHISRRLND